MKQQTFAMALSMPAASLAANPTPAQTFCAADFPAKGDAPNRSSMSMGAASSSRATVRWVCRALGTFSLGEARRTA